LSDESTIEATPSRGGAHDALSVFLGDWRAEGMSYGGTDQSGADPKAHGVLWVSRHTAKWHTGKFFLIQDERAQIAGKEFDTLSVVGVENGAEDYVARTFDNNGFYRHYRLAVNGRTWVLNGDTERAHTVFDADGNTQTITWEWLRDGKWLPLCDRVAVRCSGSQGSGG
jgi:hypothetical protein